ncbi:MAG: hypothetical protein V4803_34635, partial [Burkholderia gladioli]
MMRIPGSWRASSRAADHTSFFDKRDPMILVTGGAGFIGANFVLDWFAQSDEPVLNIDKLTYA